MRTRSQTRNRNHQQQAQPAVVEPFHLEEPFDNPPLVSMADNRTMTQLLQAPTEGYKDAIVIPEINANFELKHGLINLVQNKQFSVQEKRSTCSHPFNPDLAKKEPPRSILTWGDLVSKFINQLFPPSKMTNLHVSALTTEVLNFKNMMKDYALHKQNPSTRTQKRPSRVVYMWRCTYLIRNCPATEGQCLNRDNIQEYDFTKLCTPIHQGNTNPRPPVSLTFSEAGVLHVNLEIS
ncbi:hypothetical protein Tco_0531090 [Tanacetum coccineum]